MEVLGESNATEGFRELIPNLADRLKYKKFGIDMSIWDYELVTGRPQPVAKPNLDVKPKDVEAKDGKAKKEKKDKKKAKVKDAKANNEANNVEAHDVGSNNKANDEANNVEANDMLPMDSDLDVCLIFWSFTMLTDF